MSAPGSPLLPHAVSAIRPLLGLALLAGLAPGRDSVLVLPAVLLACASDWGDGVLARRLGLSSRRGRLVDNACDVVFLLCLFAFFALSDTWSPPVWGRLVRHWPGANWLPVYALAASFGIYALRLRLEIAAGREPARSPRGHAAGILNYGLAVVGAVETVPGVNLGPWLLEPAMVSVAVLNLWSVPENLRLLFHREGGGPRMPA